MLRRIRNVVILAVLFHLVTAAGESSRIAADEKAIYEGQWRTTNRKLDGIMTCVVTPLEDERWQGRFYGVWQGVPFDYLVTFEGSPSNLRGTAKIDGADYTWKGQMTTDEPRTFKGTFGGNRYTGNFNLKQKTSQEGK